MSISLFNQKFNETASGFSPLLYTVVKWGNVLGLLAIASKNRVVFSLAIIDNCVGFSLAKQYPFLHGYRFRSVSIPVSQSAATKSAGSARLPGLSR